MKNKTNSLHDRTLFQSRALVKQRFERSVLLFVTLAIAGSIGFTSYLLTYAQESSGPWTVPVNISKSGAASQPAIVVAPNGKLHALWWDTYEGEQYAQTTSVTGTTWSRPIAAPQIAGERTIMTNTRTGKATVRLSPPVGMRLLSDSGGSVLAFWRDVDNQLAYILNPGTGWGNAIILADSALSMDAVTDVKGTVHLVYVRSLNTSGNPSGIYYRTTTGGIGWSVPVLVFASTYFRNAKPDQIYTSVAGDGRGSVLVTWDDQELRQSLYSRSADGGRTWSNPQPVSNNPSASMTQARVLSTAQGDFIFLGQIAGADGCGLSQRRSTDGGQTWSAPERVLTSLTRCTSDWSFSLDSEGRLWLIGEPQTDTGILAAWDGRAWSKPTEVRLGVRDAVKGNDFTLGCLTMALAGKYMGVIGCDAANDVWTARSAVGLGDLTSALKTVWSPLETMSDRKSQAGLPALSADTQGKVYALWSQAADGELGTDLYAAVWESNTWSRAARVLGSTNVLTETAVGNQAAKAEQPSVATDNQSRLHAVWSGGLNGQILYSWTYVRDAMSAQAWTQPIALPAPSAVASWPNIVADPRGDVLHVIYAVPFNEGRGIYYVRSNDDGSTWLKPVLVFDAVAIKWDSVDKPQLALDAQRNVLHAVWLRTRLPDGAGAQAVAYSRSTDGGQSWSTPVTVAEGATDWPRVAVSGEGQVQIVWNQAPTQGGRKDFVQPTEIWSQFSPDGGGRWAAPALVPGLDDVSGPVSLSAYGARSFHIVGVGKGSGGESALLYNLWDGGAWGEREIFGLGQNATLGNASAALVLPGTSRLVVAIRSWVIEQDGVGRFEVMTTDRTVAAATAAAPAPTFTPLPTFTPTPTLIPQPTATSRPRLPTPEAVAAAPSQQTSSTAPLIIGGLLTVAIVLGVVIGRVVAARRR